MLVLLPRDDLTARAIGRVDLESRAIGFELRAQPEVASVRAENEREETLGLSPADVREIRERGAALHHDGIELHRREQSSAARAALTPLGRRDRCDAVALIRERSEQRVEAVVRRRSLRRRARGSRRAARGRVRARAGHQDPPARRRCVCGIGVSHAECADASARG
jgi:hypothetical protein